MPYFPAARRRPAPSDARVADGLAQGPSNDVQHFLYIAVRVALLRGRSNAALDVILQDQQGHRIDRRPERGRLLQDVDAVFAPLDHPFDAPNLALDAAQPADQDGLIARVRVPEGRIQLGRVHPGIGPVGHSDRRTRETHAGCFVLCCQLALTWIVAARKPPWSEALSEGIIPPGSISGNVPRPAGPASNTPSG